MDNAHWFFTKLLKIDNSNYDQINQIVSNKLSVEEQKLLLSVTTKSITIGVVIGTIYGIILSSIAYTIFVLNY